MDLILGKRHLLGLSVLAFVTGCASVPYRYGAGEFQMPSDKSNTVRYGGEQPCLDWAEQMVHAPARIVSRSLGKAEDPLVVEANRSEAVELSSEYLRENFLQDVQIDVRRYSPAEQWKRIRENNRVSPALKYTAGTLSWAGYTLFPGRVWHVDKYNVFSNSMSLNSSDPVSALYAAAEAKEYRRRKLPGVYWGMQMLPGVPVVHILMMGRDASGYARAQGDEKLKDDVRKHALTEAVVEVATEFIEF
ncbi:MAG: hypothetical protein AAF664_18505 [Planctomycetota bacterium]